MILVIVAEDSGIKETFLPHFEPRGFSVVQYSHPLKALDNIEEIDPDVLLCNASDYPRHWKLLIRQLRERRKKEEGVFILLIPDDFDSEEANKASYLGVNALIPESSVAGGDFGTLDESIGRYKSPTANGMTSGWIPSKDERVEFLFTHPENYRMVSGRLTELSPAGGKFRADEPGDLAGIETGMTLRRCTLGVDGEILELDARIIDGNGTIALSFLDFVDDGFMKILDLTKTHAFSNS